MNNQLYQRILYFIIATIALTLLVQVYWNYKNYEKNLQNFQNDVQISLDNALENYYAQLTEKNHMTFIDIDAEDNSPESVTKMLDKLEMDSVFQDFQKRNSPDSDSDSDLNSDSETILKKIDYDSITQIIETENGEKALTFSKNLDKITSLKVVRGKKAADSIKLLKNITSIYISIQDDSLKLSQFSPFVEKELERKQIEIPFALKYEGRDSIKNAFNAQIVTSAFFKTKAKSKFLKSEESLLMLYPNATSIVLKEGLSGILISSLLVFGIIACLIYLLNIIKNQKQLSELKNDLISNITHEFKTPISTIGVAIESIRDFKGIDDKERTTNYLNMSSDQLGKLNTMVEKLLETATLDGDRLELNKEPVNLVDLLKNAVADMRMRATDELVNFSYNKHDIDYAVDIFHFDNAINNILDNALKYGGSKIEVSIERLSKDIVIKVSDNGTSLTKASKDKIFEKFYRVPKGNTHDVKGFGIGLYYSKKIIENHNGSLQVELGPELTTFKIILTNE